MIIKRGNTQMKMKTIATVGMMSGLLLGGVSVFAQTTDHGNGTQTIDISYGNVDTEADVKVDGTLGFDNTDPETPEPPTNPDL